MKGNTKSFFIVLLLFSIGSISYARNLGVDTITSPPANGNKGVDKEFPHSVFVKKLDGDSINTSTFFDQEESLAVVFWAKWCGSCKEELDTLNKYYMQWREETGVRIIAISVDYDTSSNLIEKVKEVVKSHDWKFDVYIDNKRAFDPMFSTPTKRGYSFSIPQTYIYNGKMEEVLHFKGTTDAKNKFYDQIKMMSAKNK
jgi:cytochrome c biogenesis protein CcmG/thiol:disulfide interchange protein DsbE